MSIASNPSHCIGLSLFTEHPFPTFKIRAASHVPLCISREESPSNQSKNDDFHGTLKALKSKNRFPKKWLGQHYMLSQEINEKLVNIAQIEKGDLVLEIGPGTGALTSSLVEAGAYVIAVEKDPAMVELVLERFRGCSQVEVVHNDFMKWPVRNSMDHIMGLLSEKGAPLKLAKVVSNLPFNITTTVIKRILPMGDLFSCMVLLIQDETASRLVDASPNSNEYRPMSLFVRFFSDPKYKLKVERSNFFPRPHVDAAVVSFRIKQALEYPSVNSTKLFFTVVNSAFGGKRKMIRNSLQDLYASADVQRALKSLELPENARPGELSLDQFVALYNALSLCSTVK